MTRAIPHLGASLCISLVFGISGAWAEQAYDPMRPAVNPLAPSVSAPETPSLDALPNEEFGNLPNGVGAEETYYQCVACHSTAIIRQQHLTDARWDYLWGWMVKEQGMYEPDDDAKDLILTYLKTHFSSER